MKNTTVLQMTLLFLFVSIVSCDKDNEPQPDFISANLNAQKWNALPEITMNTMTDTLTLLGVGNENVVVFKIRFNGEGVYDLSGKQASYYTSIGQDVITSLYTLDETPSSQITITAYNSEQKTIKGSFELSLLKDWSNPENGINGIDFSKGRFKATISD